MPPGRGVSVPVPDRLRLPMSSTYADLESVLADIRRLHPVLIDLSLGRIAVLLEKLGRPQDRLPPVIHVAGTNGKGSTVAYLKAMLEAGGLRAHTYTSPHLVRFNERIRLAGSDTGAEPIALERLIELLRHTLAVNGEAPITFFEITTAAAFLAFSEVPADALVLEVGLGGRLDATNVIDQPAVSVITPVSIDHEDMLGGTLDLIAREKAGILKRGRPAVIGPQPEEALDAIRDVARKIGAPLQVWGEDFEAFEQNGRLIFQHERRLIDLPLPGLLGRHQFANAGTAVAAALAFPALELREDAIGAGIAAARWPGRFSRLDAGPVVAVAGEHTEVWLDGGHNPSAGAALAQALADLDERAPKPIYLIVGMMARKDAKNFLSPFSGLVRGLVTVPLPGHEENAYSAADLAEIAESIGLDAIPEDDITSAIATVEEQDVGPKRILICGSLYLAGHVLAENCNG